MNGTDAIHHPAVPHTELISYRPDSKGLVLKAGIVGIAFIVLAAIIGLAFGRWADFMHAYLAAYLFWFGLSAGSIGLTMLHHLTGGRWGDIMRPLLETGARGVFLMALLGLPLLIWMGHIYPWAQDPSVVNLSAKLKHQREYWTNPVGFSVRYFIYFAVLGFLAWRLNSKYRLRDEMAVQDPEHNSGVGYRVLSGPGILILGIVVTLATVDWGMSTQAGWFSTMYGLLFVAGMGLTTFAFMTVAVLLINRRWEAEHAGRDAAAHPVSLVGRQDWHDLGNLMLAFTMLWGYMSLSQMLIIYSGNLPYETVFYNYRSLNGWQYVGGALIALHWALPFFLLLMRDIKRNPRLLVIVAILILLVRQVDFYYQVHPSYAQGLPGWADEDVRVNGALGLHTFLNLLTPIGIGGLWVAFFAWNLQKRRVLPAPAQEGGHHG